MATACMMLLPLLYAQRTAMDRPRLARSAVLASALRGGGDDVSFQQQYWLPLESSPAVFNDFMRRVGVAEGWSFTDVYSLDEELLAMVPSPCIAVVLLFPVTRDFGAIDALRMRSATGPVPPGLFFMHQHVGNACGTVAAVHAIVNNQDKIAVGGGPLAGMGGADACDGDASGASASSHAQRFSSSRELQEATDSSARSGATATPERGAEVDYHYVCFVDRGGQLIELDGTKPGPLNHGPIQDDLLRDAARVVRECFVKGAPGAHFNVMALVADPDGEVARDAAS